MQPKRRIKGKSLNNGMIKSGNTYRIVEPYDVDMNTLKESLQKIEEAYYSSNIKLDRIQERRTFEIICKKLPEFLKLNIRFFVKG